MFDSSELKSITRLRKLGINAVPAEKGPGSVRTGIKLLQNSRIFIHRHSKSLQSEFKKYVWKKLASGVYARVQGELTPVKLNDDGIDAIRYIVTFYQNRV